MSSKRGTATRCQRPHMRGHTLPVHRRRKHGLHVRCCAGWVNYLLLPEVINREWNGQGLISWARLHVYAPIKRRCDGVRNTRITISVVPLQVPTAIKSL